MLFKVLWSSKTSQVVRLTQNFAESFRMISSTILEHCIIALKVLDGQAWLRDAPCRTEKCKVGMSLQSRVDVAPPHSPRSPKSQPRVLTSLTTSHPLLFCSLNYLSKYTASNLPVSVIDAIEIVWYVP